MKPLHRILFFCSAACLLLLAGCSTKKNTFFTRNFHNLTAYYNVYWNGLQSLGEADDILKTQSVDNYFNVLPVFKYGNPTDTALISQQTARMIEKALKAVKKHSISIRGKEYVKTIDNAYLLLGQGFFYQQQYSKARSVYNFILSEFAANPEKYEAMLWIARTYIREGDYSMASSFISQVEAQNSSNLMKQTVRDLPLVQAEYLIAQEKYKDAVPYLQEGLRLSKDRDLKARINFILGQIEQRQNDNTRAYAYYKECLKLNPPLDLVFNARLNMALCYDGKNISSKDILKGLQKMLRDPKNQAYFGRIYYVMGEMAFRQGRDADAVAYMDMSIAASQDDPARTLLAAKRLSAYFYDGKQYIQSQKYYDIASKVVEYDDPDYYTIVSRAENLADLTVYYQQLTQSDTLKMVGKMSKREQKRYAERKAKEYRQQQEAARLAREQNKVSDMSTPGRSNWYFYNEQTKNAGLAEFNKKWGRRELEDLWFLSSKPNVAALRPPSRNQEEEGGEAEQEQPKILTQADPEYYLNQLPTTDSAYRKLDSLIEPALYHVGMIYCDRLSENAEGERFLTRLVNEYPSSIYIPSACETLCKIYRQSGDMGSYKRFADILAQRYPGTEQDERVNNPDYYRDLEANAGKVQALYEKAYDMFVRNDFQGVVDLALQVEKDYPINGFREQFLYLKTMSTAHVSGYKDMLPLAENFVNSYPESPLLSRMQSAQKRAQEDLAKKIMFPDSDPVLDQVPERQPADSVQAAVSDSTMSGKKDTLAKEIPKVEYLQPKSSERHSIVMLCSRKDRDPEVMLLRVEGFNDKFYDGVELDMDVVPVVQDPDLYMLVVSSFATLRGASGYLKMIRNNDYVFGTIEKKILFEINEKNLELLRQSGDPKQYGDFYEKTYKE